MAAAGIGLLAAIGYPLFGDIPPEASKLKMSIGAFLVGTGAVLSVVAGVMVWINAFRESIWWGLGFLAPFLGGLVSLAFVILHWSRNGKLFLTNLGGFVLACGGIVLIGMAAFQGLVAGGLSDMPDGEGTAGFDQAASSSFQAGQPMIQQSTVPVPNQRRGKAAEPKPEVVDRILDFQRKGAMAGRPTAQYDLGMRYLRGDGVEQDNGQALHWLNLAAESGNSRARNELASLKERLRLAAESEARIAAALARKTAPAASDAGAVSQDLSSTGTESDVEVRPD